MGGPRVGVLVAGHVDAVPYQLVGAAEGPAHGRHRLFGYGRPDGQVVRTPPAQPAQGAVPGALPRSMEGADQWPVTEHQRGLRRPGGQRLVQVHHVEMLVTKGPNGAQGGADVRGDGSHRTVGRGGYGVAERGDESVGWRPVAGTEDPGVHAQVT